MAGVREEGTERERYDHGETVSGAAPNLRGLYSQEEKRSPQADKENVQGSYSSKRY